MTNATDQTHGVACHCGAVAFTIRLDDGLASARRCTCSYCRMRGAVVVSVELDGIEFLRGESNLTLYQFNSRTAKHWFCKTCGIYTHHQRRSDPTLYGVNLACIDGMSPFDLAEVPVMDGVAHPSDTGQLPRLAGILRFIPS
jgi:hypothetical protein